MVKLYSKPNCVQCVGTKNMLDAKGIEYTIVDLSKDADAMSYVMGLGYRQAPVVVVDEETHWAGLRPDMIAKIAA